MRFRFDNILLGLLWTLAMSLASIFWFNTVYGFNIFSGQHWQYLAYMQAAHTPVRVGFYISMVAIIFIFIFGLYLIIRPRTRKIRLPIKRISHNKHYDTDKNASNTAAVPSQQSATSITANVPPAQPPVAAQTNTTAPSASARPPRLVIPITGGGFSSGRLGASNPPQTGTSTPTVQPADWPELREIFTSAGYVVKPAPKIKGVQIALLAIGTNETLWMGGVGIKTTDMRAAIDKLAQIFTDTLDETYISINGFVIAAPDAATSEFQDILMFNTTNELRDYITRMPNPPLPDDDDGIFDAYSEYIDAVINHIGKI